ncbi:hypothetical protein POTOM_055931 [Populus tomentosa]|uniref:Uncharacterized protein n=1 Tax=Populus tomentosa TaxID=118781 RepID=A0A8X8C4F1_POPTO|nr:hypothetical protein POTOM_055931 [Populus tomentosa]
MGRSPCCSKEGLNRGAWTASEDKILIAYIKAHGEGNWRNLPERAEVHACHDGSDFFNFGKWNEILQNDIDGDTLMKSGSEYSLGLFDDLMFKDGALNHCPEDNAALDLESLAHLLDSEEWP